jgi:hypothetical protein
MDSSIAVSLRLPAAGVLSIVPARIDSRMGSVSLRPSAIAWWSDRRQVGQLASQFDSADPTADESFAV